MKNSDTLKVTPSGDREIVMTRLFDAPRGLVFDALTKPELIRRWLLGPGGWSMAVCTVDLRVGGAYRYVLRNDRNGTEMGWGGTYREILRPERIVHTERFDQHVYSGESVITTVLTEKGGKTIFTARMLFESKTARDTVLSSGMERGAAASYDKLEQVLQSQGQKT
ncbi:MAG: ATPase [Armatimonadetes bacterium 13_1_40CM_64_14]|nr:MAG: ATPase [Armatimonadetes bacterium 13_1_40CM_64_14]